MNINANMRRLSVGAALSEAGSQYSAQYLSRSLESPLRAAVCKPKTLFEINHVAVAFSSSKLWCHVTLREGGSIPSWPSCRSALILILCSSSRFKCLGWGRCGKKAILLPGSSLHVIRRKESRAKKAGYSWAIRTQELCLWPRGKAAMARTPGGLPFVGVVHVAHCSCD
jgi:hypothetical protein